MINSIKTAVSIPGEIYRRAEVLRRRAGKSRSELYANALEAYFQAMEVREKEARYAAGYQSKPENLADIEAGLKASSKVLISENW